jgi:hypothetical protein
MLFHAAIACLTILSVSVLIAHAIDAFRTQRNRSHVAVWPDAPKHFFRPSSKARSARPIPCCVPSSVAQPAEPEEIDIVVFGHPTFLVEGKPITPPVVAADDARKSMSRYLSCRRRSVSLRGPPSVSRTASMLS